MKVSPPQAVVAGVFVLAVVGVSIALVRGTAIPFAATLIEREATAALGRAVTVTAPPWIRIGEMVEVRLTDVSIANSPWADADPLARLERAEASIDLASLWSGPVLVERFLVDGLQISLSTDGGGRSNLPALPHSEAADEPRDGPRLILREATVRNVRLQRTDGRTGEQLDFFIRSLTQREADEDHIDAKGAGRFQGRAWALSARHSGLPSLLSGEALSGSLEGSLGDLRLTGEYRLPDVDRLDDLVVEAELTGTIPPRIAALSPLLETTDPLLVRLTTVDIDPGISLDATIDVGDLDIKITGSIDHPGQGDGLNLAIDADAGSLPNLARALDLGSTDDVPVTINGRLRRKGRRLEIDEFLIRAGDHRVEGTIHLPLLPGTTDAELDLHARGPDYSFYQRLLKRPFELRAPYAFDLVVTRAPDQRERVDATLDLGTATATVSGALGDFPSYADSNLTIDIRGEDLSLVGRLIESNLPAIGFSIAGAVAVASDGRVSTKGLTAAAAGAQLTVRGGVDSYPEFDDLDAALTLTAPSLAETSTALGMTTLGDVAASLELSASGSARDLELDAVVLKAGGTQAKSTSGALQLGPGKLASDLRFEVLVAELPALLGDLAPAQMPAPQLSFIVQPLISEDRYDFAIEDLAGPQLSGSARVTLRRSLRFDDSARITADLQIENPAALLPTVTGYTPVESPLQLKADTRGGRELRINATLSNGATELLSAELLPGSADDPVRISVRGEGESIRAFGSSPYLPRGTQAYRIDGSASLASDTITVSIADLRLGDSEVSGSGDFDRTDGAVRATVDIARMDLPAWLAAAEQARNGGAREELTPAKSPRVIPDTPLPLALLDGPPLAVTVSTGDLGLKDPKHPTRSLIEHGALTLDRSQEKTTLEITDLKGSRGTLTLGLQARRIDAGTDLSVELRAGQLPLGIITVGGYDVLPRHDLDANLSARGSTPRELAATLDGTLLLVGGSGTLPKTSTSVLTESFLQQLFVTLIPTLKNQQPTMEVECTVLAARAAQGQVKLDPGFVIRTARVDLSARGEVDLVRERLQIRFDNQARRGLGISAASFVNPYVQITGTLKRPTLGLDVAGSAIAGGAAFATGGLTVLAKPLFGRFLSKSDPCEVALERWAAAGS